MTELSREIQEKQGILQGNETSTQVYISKADQLLKTISTTPDTFRIGKTPVGAPTCADDICLITTTYTGAQTAAYIAQNDANRERYEFSSTKTKMMICNTNLTPEDADKVIPVEINGQEINYSGREKHLGVERTPNTCNSETIQSRIKTGRRTAYSLMNAGFSGLNGVSPEVSIPMLNTFIEPTITHSLEAIQLTEADYKILENNQRMQLRQLQHLPPSTAIPALYLLTGTLPIRATIHKNMLRLFGSIMRRKN